MKKYRKMEKKITTSVSNCITISKEIVDTANDARIKNRKALECYNNIDKIIANIDEEFAHKTSILNPKDQSFLWLAVALQTTRQIFQPKIKIDVDKPDKAARGKSLTEEEKKKLEKVSKKFEQNKIKSKFISKEEYYRRPVPYDAMNGQGAKAVVLDGIKKSENAQLCGRNHHAATLGHDPILGYIFGTLNIMTCTITFNKLTLQTNRVALKEKKGWEQTIEEEVGFFNTLHVAIEAEKEDYLRIPFAVGRHQIHISTDSGTKMGLQIPFLPAKKQQELLIEGWNSEEVKKILKSLDKYKIDNITAVEKQFEYAFFINMVIETLHLFMYDEEKDDAIEMYRIRTKRILAISNGIASSINFAYFAGMVDEALNTNDLGIAKKGIEQLDVGGYIEAVHQIVSNKKLQEQIRREYLENGLYKVFLEN